MHGPELGSGALFGGAFRVSHRIGAGGMAVVYAAEQIATGQPRALKLMHPQLLADEGLRARFEQEARVSGSIPSEHVVQVIDAGVDGGSDVPWIAMELLDGEDLEAYVVRRGPLPVSDALEILRQIGHALAAAHRVGIIHRDLKPQNIFVAVAKSADHAPSIKVLDFGIAKVVAEAHQSTSTLGTPLWMSPEHSDPRATITVAADVWSLALVAFWLLTAREFWICANNPEASMQAILRELLLDPLPSASARATELGAKELVPDGFDAWFARCLSRDPADRFADASAATAALEEALGVEPSASIEAPRSTGAHERVRKAFENSAPVAVVRSSAPAAMRGDGTERRRAKRASLQQVGLVALSTALVASAAVAYALGVVQIGSPDAQGETSPEAARNPPVPSPATSPAPVASAPSAPVEPSASAPVAAPAPVAASSPVAKGPARRPFDAGAAQRALSEAAWPAKTVCGGMEGPRAISVTVYFNPNGTIQRILSGDAMLASKPTYLCITQLLHSARVAPFDGTDLATVATTVAIP